LISKIIHQLGQIVEQFEAGCLTPIHFLVNSGENGLFYLKIVIAEDTGSLAEDSERIAQ
jgi:hypothetical protein